MMPSPTTSQKSPEQKKEMTAEEQLISEMRIPGSFENNTDPNDLFLEIEKNLQGNLGPVDTASEAKEHNLDHDDDDDNLMRPK